MAMWLALALLALPPLLFAYAYVGYPALLWIAGRLRRYELPAGDPAAWPMITITVPAYNAEPTLARTLDRLLAADYPADRRQILVVSDASSDGTDAIARSYAPRGVELLRLEGRRGKTAGENAAVAHARGEIIVNVDAAIEIPASSLKALIRAFQDPTVGVASGRDVSVGVADREGTGGESGYVGYEMRVRALETRAGGIVGASGCFYGFRRAVHAAALPEELSWDFASPLAARRLGFRSVSVHDAVCLVPRTPSLQREFHRKVRTMSRGLDTLWHEAELLDPLRYGAFAWKLFSHKLARWLVPLTAPGIVVGLLLLFVSVPVARPGAGTLIAAIALSAAAAWLSMQPRLGERVPRLVALPGFIVASFAAGFLAWVKSLRRSRTPIWEPTPRTEVAR